MELNEVVGRSTAWENNTDILYI